MYSWQRLPNFYFFLIQYPFLYILVSSYRFIQLSLFSTALVEWSSPFSGRLSLFSKLFCAAVVVSGIEFEAHSWHFRNVVALNILLLSFWQWSNNNYYIIIYSWLLNALRRYWIFIYPCREYLFWPEDCNAPKEAFPTLQTIRYIFKQHRQGTLYSSIRLLQPDHFFGRHALIGCIYKSEQARADIHIE